ncbi:hypothetical protein [Brumimicrobium oceani]|uniref:hypothetical protein n=1 Tax=Brumimicrobium oceani TaxID=2100725 RepID=UPI0011B226D0|nr:hypothetical protein [Brumimicrobium oceani]
MNFNPDDLKKIRDEHKLVSQKIHLMIDHLLSNKNSDKEKLEISHVGKFLILLNEEISIKSKSESPDFIIQVKDKIIGLEHETIRNTKTVGNVGSIKNLIQRVEKYYINTFTDSLTPFKEKYPNCPNMIVDIRFIDDLFSFKKQESSKLSMEIANYVHSLINGEETDKPHYINRVSIKPHTQVKYILRTNINKTEKLEFETLKFFIDKKESKVARYKRLSKLNEQWLLLVAGSLNRDSFEIENDFNLDTSGFERIYLLDDFNAKYYRIK